MKKILFLLAAGMMVGALIIGCSTEKPWSPDPARPLQLSFVAGPADTVSYGATISFSWTSKGGNGQVEYEYRMGSTGDWSTPSAGLTNVTFANIVAGNTFYVRATDAAADQQEISRQFWVGTQGTDTVPPTVGITASPVEGSFVATGSNISFTWAGFDAEDGDNLLYWYSFAGSTSDTSSATTVTLTDVAAGTDTLVVYAMDQRGNVSEPAMVWFIIKDASILYVDDYEWLDLNGNRDMVKERDQKQFYRDVLEGYAFAEWDVSLQGMPDNATLAPFSTVLFASDGDCADGTWWYEIGSAGGGPLRSYMENGGKLVAIGSEILPWIYNNQPPLPGDFEYDWFGIVDTLVMAVDTTWYSHHTEEDTLVVVDEYWYPIADPDSISIDTSQVTWDYWDQFTWAINAGNFLGLPDSMKIDVAKNGDQDGIASNTPGLRDGAVVLFKWGLYVNGLRPEHAYDEPIAHLFSVGGEARSAMLNFDGYSTPLPGMRQTIGVVLTQFGE